MKLPKSTRDQLIMGILPMLAPAVEKHEVIKQVEGRALIYNGITKDKDGKTIHPSTQYVFTEVQELPVNHVRRMLEVIARNTTFEAVKVDLARYLAKYGISKEAVHTTRISSPTKNTDESNN